MQHNSEEEVIHSQAPKKMTTWMALGFVGSILCIICISIFAWAYQHKLDTWKAKPFGLIVYAAIVSGMVSMIGYWKNVKTDQIHDLFSKMLHWVSWTLLLGFILWLWFPPLRDLLLWWDKTLALFRLILLVIS